MWNLYKRVALLCIFPLIFGCTNSHKTNLIKAEFFFNDLQQSSFHISPDGKNISYLQPFKGKLNIFVKSLENNRVSQLTTHLDQSIRNYFWAGNHKIFYLKDKDGADHFQLYDVDVDSKQTRVLKTAPQTRIEVIDQIKKKSKLYSNCDE